MGEDSSHLQTLRSRWWVLPCASLVMFMEMGTLKAYGVMLDDLTRDLGTSTGVIGLAVGLSHGLTAIFAIVNPPLLRRFSIRQLVVAGSLFGSLGYILSACARNGLQFLIALSTSGVAYSIAIFPAMTIPVYYFPDDFAIASSIIITGGGVGMMTLPVLAERLVEIYGWRGAIALIGAISLHCVVCGALMKPVPRVRQTSDDEHDTELDHDPEDENQNLLGADSVSRNNNFLADERYVEVVPPDAVGELSQELFDDVDNADGDVERGCKLKQKLNSVFSVIQSVLDLTVIRLYPRMISVVITFALDALSYSGWVVFLVPNAIAKGYLPSRAVLLATVGGLANIFGRLLTGVFSSIHLIPDELSYSILSATAAVAFFANNFAYSFPALTVLAAINGFCSGAKIVMINLLPKSAVPDEEMVLTGISLVMLASGLAEPIGGLLMGIIFDKTKSYNFSFTMCGLVDTTSCAVLLVPWLCAIYFRRDRSSHPGMHDYRVRLRVIQPETNAMEQGNLLQQQTPRCENVQPETTATEQGDLLQQRIQ